jgi:quinol monooxygenase YgiN
MLRPTYAFDTESGLAVFPRVLGYNPATMAKRKAKKSASQRLWRKNPKRRSRAAKNAKLPKDAVTLIVLLRAREGQETLLEAELRALINPTRKEDGCLTYDLHRSGDAPGGFLLHEVWATRQAHTAHTATPHFLRWNARKDALLTSRDSTFWKQVG